MLGPGNARWLCPSSSFSRCLFSRLSFSLTRPRTPTPPLRFSRFPFLSPLTSTTPLPLHGLCLSRSPRLSRSRVLLTRTRFSSPLSSIRAGLPAPTHPPPHDGKGCQGGKRERGGWVEEVTRSSGRDGRTGPTHRSRDIHFHFIFLARYRRQRKVEKKRKEKKRKEHRARARALKKRWSGKISAIPPSVDRSGLLHPVRANSNSRLHSRGKKKETRLPRDILQERHIPAVVYR